MKKSFHSNKNSFYQHSCLIFYSLNNGRLDFSLNNYLQTLFLSIFHATPPPHQYLFTDTFQYFFF